MDLYHVHNSNNIHMDYNHDYPDSKKMSCSEDRFDSGLDSLKEGEYCSIPDIEKDMESLSMGPRSEQPEYMDEPWRRQKTEDGDSILHLAIIHEAKHHAIQIINMSRNNPFLNIQNNQRQTALHLAVITEQPDLVDALLKAGCDPELMDHCGNTALHIACKKGSLHCFSVLTQYRPQHLTSIIATPNYCGHNCLHLAAIHGFLSLVESLIQLGADVNAQEYCNGRTALHLAVDLQNLKLVRLLVAKGANVNSLTYGGYTPYHLTYGRQNEEIQQQLYSLTAQELRELPESDEEGSDEEETDMESLSEEDEMYDDIFMMGQK